MTLLVGHKYNKASHSDGFSVAASPPLQSRACWRRYGFKMLPTKTALVILSVSFLLSGCVGIHAGFGLEEGPELSAEDLLRGARLCHLEIERESQLKPERLRSHFRDVEVESYKSKTVYRFNKIKYTNMLAISAGVTIPLFYHEEDYQCEAIYYKNKDPVFRNYEEPYKLTGFICGVYTDNSWAFQAGCVSDYFQR
ncbi:hypothetical protein ACQUWM_09570 [Marinobacter sp. DUT-3]|uniref:hypothetical protein n=1 Tax=Marinobacter sp. DUT-3 TaxID=3412036 RepID=UPI003D174900